MRVSINLLKKYIDTKATAVEIADKLTAIGLEVEEIMDNASALKDFVVGEIKTKEKHPNADKLNILGVWDGKKMLQIVCGAPNCYVGMKSVLAHEGVVIPLYNEALKKGVIRGIESQGMMCSEKELGLSESHEGIMDVKTDLPAGTPIADVLGSDVILDVNVTPNRGDCFGIEGIARDLAATGIGEFKPNHAKPIDGTYKSPLNVMITDENCPQFVGRYIKGVKNVQSPDWMKEGLISAGLRPISFLVDVTNYLNICHCRPMHVFDADNLTGNVTVRSANEGEKLLALDGKEYILKEGMTIIADDKGAQSVAGIMGGEETSCSMETTNIFLESAYFKPLSIAKTGRLLNAESDSRTRFERGIDPASCAQGIDDATALILEYCGGEVSEVVVAGSEPDWYHEIDFDFNQVKRLVGMDIAHDKMVEILQKLGFTVNGNKISVPSWRVHDVTGSADIVEEIVRINGLDDLPNAAMRPNELPISILLPNQKREVAVRRSLATRGLNQVITWSFTDSKIAALFTDKHTLIANPIASDLDEMRPTLVANLLSAVKRNQDRGIADVQLFEVGPEFYSNKPGDQAMIACGIRAGAYTPKNWAQSSRNVDVFDAKADALDALKAMDAPQTQVFRKAPKWYHPGRSGSMCLGKNVLAHFGEIHPAILKAFDIKTPVVAFEVYMENAPIPKNKSKSGKTLKISNLMPLTRDFAFVMDKSVDAEKVLSTIRSVNKDLITSVTVFDVYEGDKLPEGKKSLAVKVHIQPTEKTLTDKEIEVLSTQIIKLVAKNMGAELRN